MEKEREETRECPLGSGPRDDRETSATITDLRDDCREHVSLNNDDVHARAERKALSTATKKGGRRKKCG